MNARIAAVLVVLLVALGGGALLFREQAASQRPGATGTLGQPLLKGLRASDVAAISIRDPKSALTIEKKDERWTIAERAGFPADLDKVREFVLKAIELKIVQAEPIADKDRARLNLDASGTAIEFQGADGKALARLIAGRKYFRSEPENPDKAPGDGRFVLLPGSDKAVYLISNPLVQATPKTADWISKAGFAAEKVKTLEYRAADGAGWKIERSGDHADWKLAGARAGEKLEITKANAASYSLSSVELADVAAKDAGPERTGLGKPATVVATTFDDLTYTLKLGRQEGDNYYATLALAGEPKPEGKDAEERLKRISERLPREKGLSAHVLLIPKSKLEDVLKKRSELLA
ncbi:MAG: DUF4340 domain-containing protein, partial [Burkholderiales bacterium]